METGYETVYLGNGEIDELGRIVVPMELRKSLNLAENDPIEIFVDGEMVVLKKYVPGCIFCGEVNEIINYKGKNICKSCMKELIK